jgi:uncharacterized protein (DUF2141 family)
MRSLFLPLALVFGAATAASAQSSGKLNVSVAGVRNDNGSVRCGLYSSANGFREPGREMRGAVAPIKNGQATCVFNGIPAGTYAIAVFHAERNEDADGDRSVRQAQAGLRLLQQSLLDLRTAQLRKRRIHLQRRDTPAARCA